MVAIKCHSVALSGSTAVSGSGSPGLSGCAAGVQSGMAEAPSRPLLRSGGNREWGLVRVVCRATKRIFGPTQSCGTPFEGGAVQWLEWGPHTVEHFTEYRRAGAVQSCAIPMAFLSSVRAVDRHLGRREMCRRLRKGPDGRFERLSP